MDFLGDAALFALGGGLGYLTRWVRPVTRTTTIAQAFGTEGTYVRFTDAHGQVVVKKFRPEDQAEAITFRGKQWKRGEMTPDGQVYNEVIGG